MNIEIPYEVIYAYGKEGLNLSKFQPDNYIHYYNYNNYVFYRDYYEDKFLNDDF